MMNLFSIFSSFSFHPLLHLLFVLLSIFFSSSFPYMAFCFLHHLMNSSLLFLTEQICGCHRQRPRRSPSTLQLHFMCGTSTSTTTLTNHLRRHFELWIPRRIPVRTDKKQHCLITDDSSYAKVRTFSMIQAFLSEEKKGSEHYVR